MYLTYRELFSIHAICQWCVGSAVLMTLLAVATAVRFLRAMIYVRLPRPLVRAAAVRRARLAILGYMGRDSLRRKRRDAKDARTE